jgi:hypothetical protein
VALQIDLAKALLAGGAAEAAAALLDRVLARPGLPARTRRSAQLLLGRAAFHSGAVRRAGELFDIIQRHPWLSVHDISMQRRNHRGIRRTHSSSADKAR